MTLVLLAILSAIQGIPLNARDTGSVSGVLRNTEGKPAAGVRVSALARSETMETALGSALASIAETDENGFYRLEGIPPGQYYVIAGRVDVPTFYPGASKMTDGAVIRVTPGSALSGMDFVLSDTSVRNRLTEGIGGVGIMTGMMRVPLKIVTEGGKTPIASANGPALVRFDVTNGGSFQALLNAGYIQFYLPNGVTNLDCRVTVSGLPAGYVVKSVTHDTADVTNRSFNLAATTAADGLMANGYVAIGAQRTPIQPIEPVTITIFAPPPATLVSQNGVRVSGVGRISDSHPVYLSGRPGTVFSDGSFEFRDVPPGRHVVALIDAPGRARGASVIVGTTDIETLELDDVTALPLDIQTPSNPAAVAGIRAGSKLPLVAIRGRVVEETSRQPAPSGQAFISGRRGPSFPLDSDGRFEINDLLPGTYVLEIKIAGYAEIAREVVLGTEDANFELFSVVSPK